MKKYMEEKWFMETADGVSLRGTRCEACNKVFFPKKEVCPDCFDGHLVDVPLGRKGRLHAYTLSVMGPPHLKKPYVAAFVDLPEGIKVYTLLTECEPVDEVLRVGMDVEMVIEKIGDDAEGNEMIGYKFKPLGTGGIS
jgi:uncharacterized OB-fold protein